MRVQIRVVLGGGRRMETALRPAPSTSSSSSRSCSNSPPTRRVAVTLASSLLRGKNPLEVPLGFRCRALPRERFRELARPSTQASNQTDVRRQRVHGCRHRLDVAVRHEEPRLAVAHGLADTRRIGRDDRRAARGRLQIRDTPALLRRRELESPPPTQHLNLCRLVDTPKKPYAITKVKR